MKYVRQAFAALVCLGLIACQSQPTRTPLTVAEQPASSALPQTETSLSEGIEAAVVSAYFLLPPAPEPTTSSAQVLQRLRERLVEPSCRENSRVAYWQGRYAGSPQRFAAQVDEILPMMGLVLDELDRYQLPGEYALLPIAESWYRPDARGSGDHVGLWQFGRSTAASFALPVGATYDARMDPVASTDAALRYLAQMQNRFGDWRLATAAYNAGPNRVQRLLDQHGESTFSLARQEPSNLPSTTFEHVAKIEALACLLRDPERFGIPLPKEEPFDPLIAIRLPAGQSSLAAIAQDRDISADLLATLNPAFRQGFIARNAPRSLLIPVSLAAQLSGFELPAVATSTTPTTSTDVTLSSAGEYIVRRGDTLGAIAKRHGVKLQTLFQLNRLNARSVLRPGQRIRLEH